jgi:hypothetical protein
VTKDWTFRTLDLACEIASPIYDSMSIALANEDVVISFSSENNRNTATPKYTYKIFRSSSTWSKINVSVAGDEKTAYLERKSSMLYT